MRYYKFPKWLKRFYPGAVWEIFYDQNPTIYLTFDDGPNPDTTPWLLDLLEEYEAKATFFCLGKNAQKYPELIAESIQRGHRIGNHTQQHINSAFSSKTEFINDLKEAAKYIESNLFRPPYGKLKPNHYKAIQKLGYTTVLWSYIAYDFDRSLASEKRIEKAKEGVSDGGVVVFHDSEKAFPQLKNELPILMDFWKKQGYQFKAITG